MSERPGLLPLFTWRSAICESDLAPTTRHVAVTLSLYMNERGGSAHPGATRLAHDTGLHVSTIRAELGRLVAAGWLALVTHGGEKGERKTANAYEARIPATPLPLADADPSPTPTRRPDCAHPSSSPRSPLAHDEPISSGTLQRTPLRGDGDDPPAPDTPIAALASSETRLAVAAYAGEYKLTHGDASAPSAWRAAAGRAATAALADGVPPDVVVVCLAACARENKHPGVLAHVIADWQRERAEAAS